MADAFSAAFAEDMADAFADMGSQLAMYRAEDSSTDIVCEVILDLGVTTPLGGMESTPVQQYDMCSFLCAEVPEPVTRGIVTLRDNGFQYRIDRILSNDGCVCETVVVRVPS